MPERGIDCTDFAACCRTSSFAMPFNLRGSVRMVSVSCGSDFASPRNGHLARIHSHLLT